MWRLLMVVVALGALGSACSEGLSAEEDFVQRMERLREATFTVTYDSELPDGSAGAPVTWYRMGDFERLDSRFEVPGASGEKGQRSIVKGSEGSYYCSDSQTSTTSGQVGCVLQPTNSSLFYAGPPWGLGIAIQRPDVLAVEGLDKRTFAATDASCFGVEADSGDGSDLVVCLTSDGVPLYVEMLPTADFRIVYTAVNVSDEVPDGIFEPPMEVVGAAPICSGPNALGNCGPQDKE